MRLGRSVPGERRARFLSTSFLTPGADTGAAVQGATSGMRIVFVHTPVAALSVPERLEFWRNFDIQYHAAHPGLRHMRNCLWELPHWMHWLAGVLVAEGFTSLAVIDFYTSQSALASVDRPQVQQALAEQPGDVYLFSPMTPNLHLAFEIADLVKATYPNCVTVFGGVVATPLHRAVARHPSVDYVVWDRGEYALPALLRAIDGRADLDGVGNLTCKTDGGMVVSRSRYPSMPVNEIPFPKVDLFPASAGDDIRYLRQVYGLGCPYKCGFCTIQTINRKAEYFAIDRVLAEIRAYRRYYGASHNIYWGDETFTLHAPPVLALCAALEAEGNVSYDCQTRLNCLADSQVLAALRRSGCRWIEIGLETADQQSQNLFKQRSRVDRAADTLKRVRDEGLAACAFMVHGFPNQTLDDLKHSIDWVCSLIARDLLQASYFFGLVPYPGSAMHDAPESFGMTLHHQDYSRYHEDMAPVFDSPFATSDEMYGVFLQGVREIGEAMSKKPYFGERPAGDQLPEYGAFWSGAHV
jgi:radical SAM superfamily enzyme YgiQ (UPF0313 family)